MALIPTHKAVFTVTLAEPPEAIATVDWATAPGTAEADVDYEEGSGTLEFAIGEQTKTIEVLTRDPALGGAATFHVVVSNPMNCKLSADVTGDGVLPGAPVIEELSADDAVFQQIPGVVVFEDNFTGSGFLEDHTPDVNIAADAAWDTEGNGVYGAVWGASGREPTSPVVVDGRLVTPSPNSGPTILDPGKDTNNDDNTPPPEVRVGTYTVTWDWKSPRDDAGDSAYGSFAYPWQLSVGKSDITLAVDGYRDTVGASINGDIGGPRTLSFYGAAAVPVTYEADTVYQGKMIVEPGKRTLEFLGVTLEQLVPDETVDFLIVGPLYLHLGENASLGFIKVVTGIA